MKEKRRICKYRGWDMDEPDPRFCISFILIVGKNIEKTVSRSYIRRSLVARLYVLINTRYD
jgi:hypothetical protein